MILGEELRLVEEERLYDNENTGMIIEPFSPKILTLSHRQWLSTILSANFIMMRLYWILIFKDYRIYGMMKNKVGW